MVASFQLARTPHIIFGSGKLKTLPNLLEPFGSNILLITGKRSFVQSENWDKLLLHFESAKVHWSHYVIDKEPTPELVDTCISEFSGQKFDAVVAIGGGSVMDAGKAISAMFCQQGSVKDYLEGVGTRNPTGEKVPYIAVPTTAGTGSEATKNGVISEIGENGFKKSIRHDNYVPDIALIDPELALNTPADITAQSGMDAFTQLLESYLSTNANPATDALAVDGLRNIRDGLVKCVEEADNLEAREKMAYAALNSGITLANAGLGTIHGFASSVGGFFDIPHGLICARMMAPVNRITVEKLKKYDQENVALSKYARAGKLFSKDKNASDPYYVDLLLETIEKYTAELRIEGLAKYGVKEKDFEAVISKTGNKNNPIALDSEELSMALDQAM